MNTQTSSSRRRAVIGVLLLAAIAAMAVPADAAFWGDSVKGNGRMGTQARAVTGFDSVAVGLPAQVEIRQGAAEGVTIEADDNLLPLIETKVEGGTLQLRPVRRNLSLEPVKLRVLVDAKTIRELSVGGSGSITGADLRSRSLSLNIGGSGRIDLAKVEADKVEASIGGSGRMAVAGTAKKLTIAIGGSGDIQAERLMADDVEVSIGGSGNAAVWARRKLESAVAGSGELRYWGDPAVDSSSVGSARLRRLGAAPQ